MRFFKYLVFLLLSTISIATFAAYRATGYPTVVAQTHTQTCTLLASHFNDILSQNGQYTYTYVNSTSTSCQLRRSDGGNLYNNLEIIPNSCPSTDTWKVAWFDYGTPMPIEVCEQIAPNEYCVYENQTRRITNYPTRQMATVYSKSTQPVSTCQNKYDGVCDKNDPYGGCYTPPDDGCTRQSDGSIVCPEEATPPQPEPTCNGATYCNRPPEGCGEGYVSGSFNGQQLCVRSGPSNPPDPEEPEQPNQCTATYCLKPDDNSDCPSGYYQTTYQGQNICVKNNPTPNQPNPNDPNNNDQPPSSEPSTGDDGDSDGTGLDLKPVIDAIKALRDSLLAAIGGISTKLTTLIDGQKTSNEHLDNIEDATKAASEALGQTNEKLDKLKDSIDSQTKCLDQSTNKYRNCTESELDPSNQNNTNIPTSQMSEQSFSLDLFTVNAAYCPADKQLTLPSMFGTFSRSYSFQAMCEQTAFFGYFVLILAYSFAVSIVMRA